jgi:imidazole glycerol phosphate synthase glutamine amidotransferase subunit
MTGMIGIVDHGVGNIGSVRNMLEALGASYSLTQADQNLRSFDKLILPGVGSFDQISTYFDQGGRRVAVLDFVTSGRPLLGICLGMQVLFSGSEEGGGQGLSVVNAPIRRLSALGCMGKIPHVGFNTLQVEGAPGALAKLDAKDFYFIHSFGAPVGEWLDSVDEYGLTEYEGAQFVSAFRKGNLIATQFHPEKSGEVGLELMAAFVQC